MKKKIVSLLLIIMALAFLVRAQTEGDTPNPPPDPNPNPEPPAPPPKQMFVARFIMDKPAKLVELLNDSFKDDPMKDSLKPCRAKGTDAVATMTFEDIIDIEIPPGSSSKEIEALLTPYYPQLRESALNLFWESTPDVMDTDCAMEYIERALDGGMPRGLFKLDMVGRVTNISTEACFPNDAFACASTDETVVAACSACMAPTLDEWNSSHLASAMVSLGLLTVTVLFM